MAEGKKDGFKKAAATGGIIGLILGSGSTSLPNRNYSGATNTGRNSGTQQRRERDTQVRGGTVRKGNDTRGSRKKY